MPDLNKVAVLVLNAAYEPASIISSRRAFILLAKGAAVMESVSDITVHSGGGRPHLVPSVIRLTRYRHVPRRNRTISRRQILTRDHYTCQYCGKVRGSFDLTLDHIIPRARGGPSTWENLVACCQPCNNKKGDRTPAEAGMKLARKPLPHTLFTHRYVMREAAVGREDWKRFLFYENTTPQGETA